MATRFSLLIAAAFLLLPGAAWAQCQNDEDCNTGYICAWDPCTSVPCMEGEECPVPACPDEGECVEAWGSEDVWYGEECGSDDECPMGFSCTQTDIPCADIACDCACPPCAGEDCEPCECDCPEPEPCEGLTVGLCTYTPTSCAADSDCEEGFECVADEVCYASPGMAPCECPEPEPCDCPEEPEEVCETLASQCLPTPVLCNEDNQCPDSWECVEVGGGVTTGCACPGCFCMDPGECPADDTECISEAEACDCPPCDCPEEPVVEESESYCMPPGWGDLAVATDGGESAQNSPAADFLGHAEEEKASGNLREIDEPSSKDEDAGFCSIASFQVGAGSLPLALLPILGVFFFLRRRR